ESNVSPAAIDYIEAQGTGSAIGDRVEISAFKKAFKKLHQKWGSSWSGATRVGVGYLKPVTGHLESASGIAALIKTLLAFENEQLPAVRSVVHENAAREMENTPFYIVRENQPYEPPPGAAAGPTSRHVGIHAFGLGGVNAHILLERYRA
ncbi:MAG: hypothetical protein GY859_34640, partial [Desulfobacterales bacterium]|nr:hypothetical protein [Desulfobacterales bacterium]